MPEYDYHCEDCGHDFTEHLTINDHTQKDKEHAIHCPKCDSQNVRHVIQSVNVFTSKKS